MKAIIYTGPNQVETREKESLPSSNPVRLRVSHVGICGTDLNIFAGTHPRAKAPLVMGHELSGTIESGHPHLPKGTAVTVNPLLSCGQCTSCQSGFPHVCETLKLIGIDSDGGMAEFVDVPVSNVIPLPSKLSLQDGALAEPVAVSVHAVRQSHYKPGDQAVVFGAGTIGLCTALTLRAFGATNPIIVETNTDRLRKAEELGFQTIHPQTVNPTTAIKEITGETGCDIVFDCAGHPAVLTELTECIKARGTIVIVAAYKKPAEVNLLQGMFKELTMQFVRVYTDKDFEIALSLLAQKIYSPIITHILPPDKAMDGFSLLTRPTDAIKVLFDFGKGAR